MERREDQIGDHLFSKVVIEQVLLSVKDEPTYTILINIRILVVPPVEVFHHEQYTLHGLLSVDSEEHLHQFVPSEKS